MSGSVNKVTLVGNLGRDPEVRNTNDGLRIVNLSIATSESWKDRQTGERRERTEWHRVVIFNKHLADIAEQYLRKGSSVYLEGSLQTRKWTDAQGVEKYTTEVVMKRYEGVLTMLGSKHRDDTDYSDANGYEYFGGAAEGQGETTGPSWNSGTGVPGGDLDDEIPF